MSERFSPEKYDADEIGFYVRDLYEKTGEKARPFDFVNGHVYIEEPGIRATREQQRNRNDRSNHNAEHHRRTDDLTPYGQSHKLEHPLRPDVEVLIKPIEWHELPEDH